MVLKRDRSAPSAEIHDDVSREGIGAAFRNVMLGHLRSHVPGTNINENTFLTSDYLNHFHELVMLLEALPWNRKRSRMISIAGGR